MRSSSSWPGANLAGYQHLEDIEPITVAAYIEMLQRQAAPPTVKQHPDGRHVLLDRGRRGLALQGLDVGGYRDRLNVFEVLIAGALRPGQELLDCPVVGGSCVSVADWDREKFEELLAGRWATV